MLFHLRSHLTLLPDNIIEPYSITTLQSHTLTTLHQDSTTSLQPYRLTAVNSQTVLH